ncbi:MAG: hypothetical protein ACRD3C_24435 [Vicinamibacterales bacterium]
MGRWRTQTEHWLSSEQHDLDDAADATFARVFAALPAVVPSAGFVQRATDAAWLARARRRRVVAIGSLAASIVIAVAAGAAAYGLFGIAGGWLVTTAATVVTSSAVSLLVAGTTGVQWWFATAQAGNTVAGVAAMPQSVVVLFAIELFGAAALFILQRLLRAELRVRGTGSLCF